jgi:Acyclic terpene utilisation family protein AtuA
VTTTVHIGAGAGFAGDRADGCVAVARTLAARRGPRYLIFETLAERTLALAQIARAQDPRRGYNERIAAMLEPILPTCVAAGIRIVGNFGAANPVAAGRMVATMAREKGLDGMVVAVVEGDDLLALATPEQIRSWPVVEGLELGDAPLLAANAYLGAGPIKAALELGAHVVVTGRVVDSALALGPLMHEFGLRHDDWDRLAAGTLAGHLLECGPQITGGYFADPGRKDVAGLASVGFPIAEVDPTGSIVITKADGTGGLVDARTVTEQLLYEIHDPSAYLVPDVTLDLTAVRVREEGPDRVVVTGARGHPAPRQLKATISSYGDWLAEAEISYAGPNALRRAELAVEILHERVRAGHRPTAVRIDIVGAASVLRPTGGGARPDRDHPGRAGREVDGDFRVRLAASAPERAAADRIVDEVLALYTAGPAGGCGVRQQVTQRVHTASVLVDRGVVRERVYRVSA